MKKGLISMSVIYTFLILFLIVMFSILGTYITKNNLINSVVSDAKQELER